MSARSEQRAPAGWANLSTQWDPVCSADWTASHTSFPDVSAAVGEIWRAVPCSQPFVATQTLLIFVEDEAQASELRGTALATAPVCPGRIIFVTMANDAEDRVQLGASVRLWSVRSPSGVNLVQELTLLLGGPHSDHVGALLTPFLLADLPLVVWCPTYLPSDDRLLGMADRLILDTETVEAGSGWEPTRCKAGLRIDDLCWLRLRPWRHLIASLFDSREFRPFLHGITSADIGGPVRRASLLAGWLAAQIHLDASSIEISEREQISATFKSHVGETSAAFTIESEVSTCGALTIRRTAAICGGSEWSSTTTHENLVAHDLLSSALCGPRDGVYGRALMRMCDLQLDPDFGLLSALVDSMWEARR